MFEFDEFHHFLETTINVLSIIFNCYLLYLIRYYSNFRVTVYKYILSIDATLDGCLGAVTLLAQPIAFPGKYTIFISNGFLAGFSPNLDSLLITLFVFLLHTNIVWIPVQFLYRYRLLCKDDAKFGKSSIMIAIVAIVYSIIGLIIFMFFLQPREEIQSVGDSVLDLNNWPQHKDGYFFFGAYFTEWRMIIWFALWTHTCAATIGIVYWCEKRIVRDVDRFGKPTHGDTQKMHKEFHRALLAMAITPLATTSIPIIYFGICIALQLFPGRITALMTSGASSITLFNPLTTIMFLRCYRQATIKMFTCGWLKNSVNQTVAWPSNISSNAVAANKPALESQPVLGARS